MASKTRLATECFVFLFFILLSLIIIIIIISRGHFFLIRRQNYTFHCFYSLRVVIAARATPLGGWMGPKKKNKKSREKKGKRTSRRRSPHLIYPSIPPTQPIIYWCTLYLYRSWRRVVSSWRARSAHSSASSSSIARRRLWHWPPPDRHSAQKENWPAYSTAIKSMAVGSKWPSLVLVAV